MKDTYLERANEYARTEEERVKKEQDYIMNIMEEMVNEPREPYGKRSPGEKCKYEVQRESAVGGTPYKDVRTSEERSTLEEETIQETNKGVKH